MRLVDRNATYTVMVSGAEFTVKPFSQLQQLNFTNFQTAPYLAGRVTKVDDAIELAGTSVAWVKKEDLRKIVDMVKSVVISVVDKDIPDGTAIAEVIDGMSYTDLISLARAIDKIGSITDDEEQD